MSLLERLGRGHLSDATLARLWTDGLEAGSGTHPHLAGCAACRARFAAFDEWIDGVASTIRDEADLLRYCHFVAGTVGELLTDLFALGSGRVREREPALRARAVGDLRLFLRSGGLGGDWLCGAGHDRRLNSGAPRLRPIGLRLTANPPG